MYNNKIKISDDLLVLPDLAPSALTNASVEREEPYFLSKFEPCSIWHIKKHTGFMDEEKSN